MKRTTLTRIFLTGSCLLFSGTVAAETPRYAVIGDVPYSNAETILLPKMLADIAASGAQFIVHVGDLKGGREVCSDELLASRHALLSQSPLPLVFIPGDNDWTDCARATNGRYDPEERLATLRRLFYPNEFALGAGLLRLVRQPSRPEHQRWQSGDTLLLTLNVPGGENNWGPKRRPGAEYATRMPQVLAWIQEGFIEARRTRARTVVLLMQANPDLRRYRTGLPNRTYVALLDAIVAEARNHPGQVVIAHGDTHTARVDQPLPELAQFWRIEPPGSPFMGWIDIGPSKPDAPLGAHVRYWSPVPSAY